MEVLQAYYKVLGKINETITPILPDRSSDSPTTILNTEGSALHMSMKLQTPVEQLEVYRSPSFQWRMRAGLSRQVSRGTQVKNIVQFSFTLL